MKQAKITITLCFLFSAALIGQDLNLAKLDSLFAAIEGKDRGMGSIAISKEGELVYQRALGYQDVEQGQQATVQTKYGIGSISKVFTAVLALKLIEEGKLSLDTKLSRYFDSLPNASQITVEQLLRHRSGLHNFTDDEDYTETMEASKSREALLATFSDKGTNFPPGEKMSYSNTGFIVLSFLLEEASGQTSADLLREYIVRPCGLERTYLPENAIGGQEGEAYSYTKTNAGWSQATRTHPSIPVGAGAIVSTPSDLTRFLYCLFSGQLTSSVHLQEMTRMVDGYGLGLVQFPFKSKYAYGHTGGIDGFSSMAAYFPEENLSIAYVSNGTAFPVNDIMIGALSITFGEAYEIPAFMPAVEVAVSQLKVYEGTYGAAGFPLSIRIFVQDGVLKAQATCQPAFALEAFEKHQFRFEPAGVEIEFVPDQEKLMLKQGGVYELIKL